MRSRKPDVTTSEARATPSRQAVDSSKLSRTALLATLAVVLLGAVWLIITGLMARAQVNALKSELPQLRSQISAGNIAGATATASSIRQHAARAHSLTTGPAWSTAAAVPYLGSPLDTVRGAAKQTDRLGSGPLPSLTALATQLDPKTLRTGGDTIDISKLQSAVPKLRLAAKQMESSAAAAHLLPANTWLGPVNSARATLVAELDNLNDSVQNLNRAAQIVPTMLGVDSVQRYFIGIQNEAEARGTGGLPGAFAIVEVSHGKLSFVHFGNDTEMGIVETGLQFGADFDARYTASRATSWYVNSDMSPNFPYAAQIWAAMWQKKTGQTINGAVSVDPTAMSYLLNATGPVALDSGGTMTAQSIVADLESTAYSKYLDTNARKAYFVEVATDLSEHLLNPNADTTALVKQAAKAIGERRLLIWSADSAVQAQLIAAGVSGTVPVTTDPYSGVIVTNAAGSKLDYYLDRKVTYMTRGCGSTREVTVTVVLTNNAPKAGLAPYVTIRADQAPSTTQPGDNRVLLDYFATEGATLRSATIDGKQSVVLPTAELGHPVYLLDLELPAGKAKTIVYTLSEPNTGKPLTILRQPLVRKLEFTTRAPNC
jgi:hypothetical protein